MTYRRTWFSCVLWFLYTVLCIILIVAVGKVWIWLLASVGTIAPQVIYAVLLIPVVALYWIIRGISSRIRKRWTWKDRAARITTCVVYILIMAFAVLIRITCLKYYVSYVEIYESDGVNIEQMNLEYYDMAVLAEQSSVPSMDYGISYLYVMLLSVVLSFLGNKVVSAIFLHIILQIISMVVAYAVTRKLTGRLPACISILYLAGSLTCLGKLFRFGPEWLFFILYMAGMLAAVGFVKRYCEDKIPRSWAIVYAIVVGVLIGVLAYLDLTGASLLVVMLIAAVGKKTESEMIGSCNYSKGMNAAVIVCSCISSVAVWLGAMSAVSYVKGTDAVSDILDRLQMCYRNSFPFTSAPFAGTEHYPDIYLVGVLIISASFLVFEFFRSGREQNYMLWILMCLLVAPTPMAAYGEHGFCGLSLYVWAVLAGLGLQNCLFGGRGKEMQAVIEEVNMAVDKSEPMWIHTNTEKTANTRQNTEIQGQEQQIANTAAVTEALQPEMTENQTSKPRYIENPLPLPKKHVAREMGYRYEVREKDMKYDVEVPEDDDFDV